MPKEHTGRPVGCSRKACKLVVSFRVELSPRQQPWTARLEVRPGHITTNQVTARSSTQAGTVPGRHQQMAAVGIRQRSRGQAGRPTRPRDTEAQDHHRSIRAAWLNNAYGVGATAYEGQGCCSSGHGWLPRTKARSCQHACPFRSSWLALHPRLGQPPRRRGSRPDKMTVQASRMRRSAWGHPISLSQPAGGGSASAERQDISVWPGGTRLCRCVHLAAWTTHDATGPSPFCSQAASCCKLLHCGRLLRPMHLAREGPGREECAQLSQPQGNGMQRLCHGEPGIRH